MVDICIDKQKKREIGIHAERKTEKRNNEEKKYIKTASGSNSEGDASALLGGTRGKHQLPPPPPPFPSSSPSPPHPTASPSLPIPRPPLLWIHVCDIYSLSTIYLRRKPPSRNPFAASRLDTAAFPRTSIVARSVALACGRGEGFKKRGPGRGK